MESGLLLLKGQRGNRIIFLFDIERVLIIL
jgi:hypothetical protein